MCSTPIRAKALAHRKTNIPTLLNANIKRIKMKQATNEAKNFTLLFMVFFLFVVN